MLDTAYGLQYQKLAQVSYSGKYLHELIFRRLCWY